MTSRIAFIATLIVSVASILWLILDVVQYGDFTKRLSNKGDSYEAVAVIFVGLGGLATFVINKLVVIEQGRQEYAVNFLKNFQDSKRIRTAFAAVGRNYLDTGLVHEKITPEEALHIFTLPSGQYRDLFEAFQVLGNFFEQMAQAIIGGAAADAPLRNFYCGMYVRVFSVMRPFLPLMRYYTLDKDGRWKLREKPRPEIYIMSEKLYRRWHWRQALLVGVRGRPPKAWCDLEHSFRRNENAR